ncbi:hypothetical protein PQX77_019046 [Marasmius sp. AFHP31]|nr:hypothetical protein PQX77_019046 [Marasmius sp. AFHP31]
MVKNRAVRVDLLQYWLQLGNRFPPVVQYVDRRMWHCIRRVVNGEMSALHSLKLFLNEALGYVRENRVGSDDLNFFKRDFGLDVQDFLRRQATGQYQPITTFIQSNSGDKSQKMGEEDTDDDDGDNNAEDHVRVLQLLHDRSKRSGSVKESSVAPVNSLPVTAKSQSGRSQANPLRTLDHIEESGGGGGAQHVGEQEEDRTDSPSSVARPPLIDETSGPVGVNDQTGKESVAENDGHPLPLLEESDNLSALPTPDAGTGIPTQHVGEQEEDRTDSPSSVSRPLLNDETSGPVGVNDQTGKESVAENDGHPLPLLEESDNLSALPTPDAGTGIPTQHVGEQEEDRTDSPSSVSRPLLNDETSGPVGVNDQTGKESVAENDGHPLPLLEESDNLSALPTPDAGTGIPTQHVGEQEEDRTDSPSSVARPLLNDETSGPVGVNDQTGKDGDAENDGHPLPLLEVSENLNALPTPDAGTEIPGTGSLRRSGRLKTKTLAANQITTIAQKPTQGSRAIRTKKKSPTKPTPKRQTKEIAVLARLDRTVTTSLFRWPSAFVRYPIFKSRFITHLSIRHKDTETGHQLWRLLLTCNYVNHTLLQTSPFIEPIAHPPGRVTPEHAGAPRPHPALLILHHGKYMSLRRTQLQELFQSHHILIQGYPVPDEDQLWHSEVIGQIGNLKADVQIHDLSLRGREGLQADDEIVIGTLQDVFEEGCLDQGKHLNCLDIPDFTPGDEFRATKLVMDNRVYRHKLNSNAFDSFPFPHKVAFWHLLATKHSSHPCHIDTSGYCTMVTVQTGIKLFIILVPAGDLPSYEEAYGSLEFAALAEDMENPAGMVPIAIILRPGDTLILRPCTPHYVVTLESSLCHGSHFFSARTMTDTCFGVLHTFTHGWHITNQHETHHRASLARILCVWADRLVGSDFFDEHSGDTGDDLPDLWTISGIIDVLSLYNVIELGSLLWEERYVGSALDQRLLNVYEEARRCGKRLLEWLHTMVMIRLAEAEGECGMPRVPQSEKDNGDDHFLEIRDEYLSHQCLSLRTAIALKPVGASHQAITPETFASLLLKDFTRLPSVHRRLVDGLAQNSRKPTYLWPSRFRNDGLTYEIVLRADDTISTREDEADLRLQQRSELIQLNGDFDAAGIWVLDLSPEMEGEEENATCPKGETDSPRPDSTMAPSPSERVLGFSVQDTPRSSTSSSPLSTCPPSPAGGTRASALEMNDLFTPPPTSPKEKPDLSLTVDRGSSSLMETDVSYDGEDRQPGEQCSMKRKIVQGTSPRKRTRLDEGITDGGPGHPLPFVPSPSPTPPSHNSSPSSRPEDPLSQATQSPILSTSVEMDTTPDTTSYAPNSDGRSVEVSSEGHDSEMLAPALSMQSLQSASVEMDTTPDTTSYAPNSDGRSVEVSSEGHDSEMLAPALSMQSLQSASVEMDTTPDTTSYAPNSDGRSVEVSSEGHDSEMLAPALSMQSLQSASVEMDTTPDTTSYAPNSDGRSVEVSSEGHDSEMLAPALSMQSLQSASVEMDTTPDTTSYAPNSDGRSVEVSSEGHDSEMLAPALSMQSLQSASVEMDTSPDTSSFAPNSDGRSVEVSSESHDSAMLVPPLPGIEPNAYPPSPAGEPSVGTQIRFETDLAKSIDNSGKTTTKVRKSFQQWKAERSRASSSNSHLASLPGMFSLTWAVPANLKVDNASPPFFEQHWKSFSLNGGDRQDSRVFKSDACSHVFWRSDILRIDDQKGWLNGDCIDGLAYMLRQTHKEFDGAYINSYAVSDHVRVEELHDRDWERLWKNARLDRYWDSHLWIIPLHLPDQLHWALALVDARSREILFFDSLISKSFVADTMLKIMERVISRLVKVSQRNGHPVTFPSLLSLSG